MYRMLPWLPEPITASDSCKFTSRTSEKFPPFLKDQRGKPRIRGKIAQSREADWREETDWLHLCDRRKRASTADHVHRCVLLQFGLVGVLSWVLRSGPTPREAVGARAHDAAHGAFMTLPQYPCFREGETPQVGSGSLSGELLSEDMPSGGDTHARREPLSGLLASASVWGQNLLTFRVIYQHKPL